MAARRSSGRPWRTSSRRFWPSTVCSSRPTPVSDSSSWMSRRRQGVPLMAYSLSPERYSSRVTLTSVYSIGRRPAELSMVRATSARPRAPRLPVPAKMTSSILPPRSDFGPCSPSTQAMASTTLDLPEPLGPTMTVIPGSKSRVVFSANDLNPRRVSDFRNTRLARTPSLPLGAGMLERASDDPGDVGATGGKRFGAPDEAPKLTKPWLGQGCFLGGRGAEALDLAKGELLLRYREVPLELGDTRFEGIQLPQDHVGGWLTYVAHERLRHPGSSSHCSGFGVTAALLSAGLARHKGRPAPCGTADDCLRFVPWERKTQYACMTPPIAAGRSSYRVWAVPET